MTTLEVSAYFRNVKRTTIKWMDGWAYHPVYHKPSSHFCAHCPAIKTIRIPLSTTLVNLHWAKEGSAETITKINTFCSRPQQHVYWGQKACGPVYRSTRLQLLGRSSCKREIDLTAIYILVGVRSCYWSSLGSEPFPFYMCLMWALMIEPSYSDTGTVFSSGNVFSLFCL